MLTTEQNETLTRVGPGTPAGELLRRYWFPVVVANEITDEHPTKFVRLLAEDLVLFKDKSGRVGLLADHCSHRGASLLYGRVEERGIACAYHGWLYDCEGNILETPPERNEAIMNSVKHTAYPVKQFLGLYWAYLGPDPAPLIPPYAVWMRKDLKRTISVQPLLHANWLQAMENSVDPAHLDILHQPDDSPNTTRGTIDQVDHYDFHTTSFGIMKSRVYKDGRVDEHPLVFPNILRRSGTQIRVPVDDTHTWMVHISYRRGDDPAPGGDADLPVRYLDPIKDPPDKRHPHATYRMQGVPAQDQAMWETEGEIFDRTKEHLSYSDRGVVMLRKLLMENIRKVQEGKDPLGVIRDPDHPMVDTEIELSAGWPGWARGPVTDAARI